MWTEWFFQAEQGGSRLPDYMAPPVWNIQYVRYLKEFINYIGNSEIDKIHLIAYKNKLIS